MKDLYKYIIVSLIVFSQLHWIPNSSSNVSNIIAKTYDDSDSISGTKSAIVILTEFLDIYSSFQKDVLRQITLNMTAYFSEVSYGMLTLNVDITNRTYRMAHNMSFYVESGGDYRRNYSAMSEKLTQESVSKADSDINYDNYEYVLIIHPGQNITATAHLTLQIDTNDGRQINSCAIVPESDDLTVFCHETAHLLGLPDLYPETLFTQGDVGAWDLMGYSRLHRNSPPQLSSWSRIKLGWLNSSSIETIDINSSGYPKLLYPLEMPSSEPETKAIKVLITTSIFYLVEYRNQTLSDKYLPESGVLIYLCDESASNAALYSVRIIDISRSGFQPVTELKTYPDAALGDGERFSDPVNGIQIVISHPNGSLPKVTVYRREKLHMLKIHLSQSNIMVKIRDRPYFSDEKGEIVAILPRGNHTISVYVPHIVIQSVSLKWSDGSESNPRNIQILSDTVITCFFSVDNFPMIVIVVISMAIVLSAAFVLLRRKYSLVPREDLQREVLSTTDCV
jgi:M6 family metalloprotease-like protein